MVNSCTSYGQTLSVATGTPITANPLRYTGGYTDTTGLYKLGARYYDPNLGRFTQMDPTGQETNAYAYVNWNPINATDPAGTSSGGCFGSLLSSVGLRVLGELGVVGGLDATELAATTLGLVVGEALTTGGLALAGFGVLAGVAGVVCLAM